ncbi:MAG: methyltransferase domain-containing protein [Verrucomicrobiae bacterium]|nr:methyltransferase domain-containing protein [Verrucomicrobiae bacterium]
MSNKMSNKNRTSDFVIQYLNRIKLAPVKSMNKFIDILYKKHDPEIVTQFFDLTDDEENERSDEEFYRLKNHTLDLSIDFARYSTDLYRRYFDWLYSLRHEEPRRILDVGCENGIATCFLATLFPDAEVIGIDISEAAIMRANELKARLGLDNITFRQADAREIDQMFGEEKFDWITAARMLNEICDFNFEPTHFWWVADLTDYEPSQEETAVLLDFGQKITDKLSDKGKFLVADTIISSASCYLFAKVLEQSGLHLNDEQCTLLHFQELGDEKKMPVMMFEKHNEDKVQLRTFLNLFSTTNVQVILQNAAYKDDDAEKVFYDLTGKELVKGFQFDYSRETDSTLRTELWDSDQAVCLLSYSNLGSRLLRTFPKGRVSTLAESMEDVILREGEWAGTEIMNVQAYRSLAERDKL